MSGDSIQAFTSAIVSCANALVREATLLFKPLGITVAQFDVLELLSHAESGLRPSELAASLVVDPSSTTYLVDQLEKRGWIRRADEAHDRRAYRVVITQPGQVMHAKASETYRAALRRLEERLSLQQMDRHTDALNRVARLASEVSAAEAGNGT